MAPDDPAVAAKALAWALERELPDITFDEELVEYLVSEWRTSDNVAEAWVPCLLSNGAAWDDDAALEVAARILERLRAAPGVGAEAGAAAADEGPRPSGAVADHAAVSAASGDDAPAEGSAGGGVGAGADGTATTDDSPFFQALFTQLKLTKYSAAAAEWCSGAGVTNVDDLLGRYAELGTALQLLPLEWRRLAQEHKRRVDAAREMAAGGGGSSGDGRFPEAFASDQPRSAPSSAAAAASVATQEPSAVVLAAVRQAEADGRTVFGPKVDPYIVYESLGSGATAIVYRCVKASNASERFAVKIISRQLQLQADTAKAEERLRRETEILFSLRHTNIVSLYEVWETREKLHLVMELVQGGDLHGVINTNGVLSEKGALYVFLQLVDALRYIHSKSVIHRDLKLENILVDQKSSRLGLLDVKITDFGQSKLIDDDSTARTRVGTMQYWAPEVLDKKMCARGYDEKVDLWSLGVVLYVMLEGRYPFEGAKMEHQVKTASVEFATSSRSSPDARSLIRGLIRARPSDRLALDACLNQPWIRKNDGTISKFMKACRERTSADGESHREERFAIQGDPADEEKLRRELWEFTTEFRFSAVLLTKEVVVTWGASDKAGEEEVAREKLNGILSRHFPGSSRPLGGKQRPSRE